MRTRTLRLLGLCLLVSSCSSRTAVEGADVASEADESVGASETSTVDTDTTGVDTGTTGADAEPCACLESLDLVCDDNRPMALHDCDLPNPCGRVNLDNPDPEVSACVLQLLVDQDQPSRFDYVAHVPGDWGDDTYEGTFFVLGPGAGIDLECLYPSYDFGPPPPVPTPAFHGLEEPTYFQDCIGKSDTVMAGCIFNGLDKMELVQECG